MEKKLHNRKQVLIFQILCCAIYFTSYITRINYAAALLEIVQSLNTSKQIASIAITGSFFAYGAGQLINGIIGDKIQPRTMIIWGLLLTSICNLLIPLLPNIYIMTVIWCFNGFFQAMLWPPLVRIMAENLQEKDYIRACVLVSSAASIGTIIVYLLVPVCILVYNWKMAFIIPAVFSLAVIAIWTAVTQKLPINNEIVCENTNNIMQKDKKAEKKLIASTLLPIIIVIVLQGILRDGITTWMPIYISEVFNYGSSLSILSTVVLPVFSIFSVSVASMINKIIKNEAVIATIMFAIGCIASFFMIPSFSSSAFISIFLMAVITGCMHGVNLMLISKMPSRFLKLGRVSSVSGLLNAFTYLGSAISIYGIAALSDNYGWMLTTVIWTIVALLGTIVCIYCIYVWSKFTNRQ